MHPPDASLPSEVTRARPVPLLPDRSAGRRSAGAAPAEARSPSPRLRPAIAERGPAATPTLALLRWSLVVVFVWFGAMKFTAYEAQGIAPFMAHSPVMSWLIEGFDIREASAIVGVIELSTAAMLAAGALVPVASALGALMSCLTCIVTLTFLLSTPGVAEASEGGFPAISAPIGQFLLKDLVLLAASFVLLHASFR